MLDYPKEQLKLFCYLTFNVQYNKLSRGNSSMSGNFQGNVKEPTQMWYPCYNSGFQV